jgi:hypothetical protein
MSPEAVELRYARVEPPPNIKNLSSNPLLVNGAANVSKNLLCQYSIYNNKQYAVQLNNFVKLIRNKQSPSQLQHILGIPTP